MQEKWNEFVYELIEAKNRNDTGYHRLPQHQMCLGERSQGSIITRIREHDYEKDHSFCDPLPVGNRHGRSADLHASRRYTYRDCLGGRCRRYTADLAAYNDGTLQVCGVLYANDEQWVLADKFRLFYRGASTTGIREHRAEQRSSAIYNLQGIRVNHPVKHTIYIVGGKKVLY